MTTDLYKLTWDQCKGRALDVNSMLKEQGAHRIYGIPRGGIHAAQLIEWAATTTGYRIEIVRDPENAEAFIDDIIDSGTTMRRWSDKYPGIPFLPLVDKPAGEFPNHWVMFPWEDDARGETVEDNIRRLLQFIGEDPTRGGLIETPLRVAKAWNEWTSGYGVDPKDVFKVFTDGGENYNQMVTVARQPFYSHCEHHMAPFFGTVDIAYIPNGKIVGLSKFLRLVDVFSRRLQVQERMTQQIADAIQEGLDPVGVAVHVRARHLCMESRGVRQQGHYTVTTAFHGALMEGPARAEFMSTLTR